MKRRFLQIISILLILSLALAGCGKEENSTSGSKSAGNPGSVLSGNSDKKPDKPVKEENPYTRDGFVYAKVIDGTAYLPDFKKERIITIENAKEALMTSDREHVIYLDTEGNLYATDSDLNDPALLVSNLSDYGSYGIEGDYFYFRAYLPTSAEIPMYRYDFAGNTLEMLLEDHVGLGKNLSYVETDTELQFYSVSNQTAELELLGTYSKELLGDRTYCTENYYDAESGFRLWNFFGSTGNTALAYENGELYCLAETLYDAEASQKNGLVQYASDDCAVIFERGDVENGGRVFLKRRNHDLITFQQEDCYFSPIAYWFQAAEDGCYAIGADQYVGYTEGGEATFYLYWLGNDGTMQKIEALSRDAMAEIQGDCLSFMQMSFLNDHTLLYFDENSFPHLATLEKGAVTSDRVLLEQAVKEYKTVPYYGGTCTLFTTEDNNEYILPNLDDPLVYIGMYVQLGGISTDGEYVYLITEPGELYGFTRSQIKSYADTNAGLCEAYGKSTPIDQWVEGNSLTSGLIGGRLDPNSIVFKVFGLESPGYKFFNGTSAKLLCTISE